MEDLEPLYLFISKEKISLFFNFSALGHIMIILTHIDLSTLVALGLKQFYL